MKQIRINAIVSQELFDFAASRNRGNKSYVVREALECFRQVQSHAADAGLSWQEWIETAAVAIEAGVKLARGEQ